MLVPYIYGLVAFLDSRIKLLAISISTLFAVEYASDIV